MRDNMLLSVHSHAIYTYAVCSLSTMQDRLVQSSDSLIPGLSSAPIDSLAPVYVPSRTDNKQQTCVVMILYYRPGYDIMKSFDSQY